MVMNLHPSEKKSNSLMTEEIQDPYQPVNSFRSSGLSDLQGSTHHQRNNQRSNNRFGSTGASYMTQARHKAHFDQILKRHGNLVPVSITNQLEFYLGIRGGHGGAPDNISDNKFEGSRIFYNKEDGEFASCSGSTPHSDNQLWRFDRAAGYPKGIHALVSVRTGHRLSLFEGQFDDGSSGFDFAFEMDEDDANMGTLNPDSLFIVFMDKDSEHSDIYIKPYNTEPSDDMYLCVSLDQGAIDICRRQDFPPTRFVLNIPACQVRKSKFEITSMTKKRKILYTGQESLTNKSDYLQGMQIKPPKQDYNGDKSVFYDTLLLKPIQDGRAPILYIGNIKDEIKVDILQKAHSLSYDDAIRLGSSNPEQTRLNLNKCGLLFEPQIFTAQLKSISYSVPSFESVKVITRIAQYDSVAHFKTALQLKLSTGNLKQIQIFGELRFVEHKFEAEQNRRIDCCCSVF